MIENSRSDNIGKLAAAAFASSEQAEVALQRLDEAGFDEDQIGFIGSTEQEHLLHRWIPQAEAASADASLTHVVFGGLLGGGAALAIPGIDWAAGAGIIATMIAGGSFGGGLVGPLLELGVEEDRAMYLDKRLQAGDIIITVHDDRRPDEAQQILQEWGGKTANTSLS